MFFALHTALSIVTYRVFGGDEIFETRCVPFPVPPRSHPSFLFTKTRKARRALYYNFFETSTFLVPNIAKGTKEEKLGVDAIITILALTL